MGPEKKDVRRAGAFTLVELVVGTVIATIVMLGAGFALVSVFRQAFAERARIRLQREAHLAAYWLDLSIRTGSWAHISGDGSEKKLVIERFSDDSQRTFEKDGNSLVIDIDGSTGTISNHLVASPTIEVYVDRVTYAFQISDDGQTHDMACSRRLMNAPYGGLWLFSEGNGDVTFDDSGHQNHGSIHGATWVTGRSGHALSFNGTDDYLRIPENDDLRTGQRIALGADIKLNSAPTAGERSTLFYLGDDGEENFVHFYVAEDGKLGAAAGSAGTVRRRSTSTAVLETDEWHTFCIQLDGTGSEIEAWVYVDGDRVNYLHAHGPTIPSVNSGDGWLGGYAGFTGSGSPERGFLDGVLDEVKLITD